MVCVRIECAAVAAGLERAHSKHVYTNCARLDADNEPAMLGIDNMMATYFGGDMEAGLAMSGQVQGRIWSVEPVGEILRTAWDDCQARLVELGNRASGS